MPFPREILYLAVLGFGVIGASSAGHAQPMPCMNEFVPLREETEKNAAVVKAALQRQAPREEVCKVVRAFTSSEEKFVKYMEANQTWCGIPDDIVKQMKANHAKTLAFRQNACSAAPAAAGPRVPPGPGLSEALGTTRVPTPSTGKPGTGTFDTLTGNALTR
jgi:hypothetical protein